MFGSAAPGMPGGLPGGARPAGPGAGGGGGAGSFVPGADAAYVIGSDGYLHALNVSNGWDNMTPALFLPANTRAMGLIVATGVGDGAVAYAATTRGCGSQPERVGDGSGESPEDRRSVHGWGATSRTAAPRSTRRRVYGRDRRRGVLSNR